MPFWWVNPALRFLKTGRPSSEAVFPCAQCREHVFWRVELAPCMAAGRCRYRAFSATQEGIGGVLDAQLGRQGNALRVTQADDLFEAFADLRIVRLHRLGKAQVAQCVVAHLLSGFDCFNCRIRMY